MTRALRLAAACLLAVIAAAGCAPRNFNLEDVALDERSRSFNVGRGELFAACVKVLNREKYDIGFSDYDSGFIQASKVLAGSVHMRPGEQTVPSHYPDAVVKPANSREFFGEVEDLSMEVAALESGRAQLTIRASRSKSLTPLEHSFDAMRSEVGDSPSLDAGPLADSGPPRERSKVTRHFAGDYYQYWFECLDAVLDLEQRIEYPH